MRAFFCGDSVSSGDSDLRLLVFAENPFTFLMRLSLNSLLEVTFSGVFGALVLAGRDFEVGASIRGFLGEVSWARQHFDVTGIQGRRFGLLYRQSR